MEVELGGACGWNRRLRAALWVGLDPYYPRINEIIYMIGQKTRVQRFGPRRTDRLSDLWNPFVQYGTSVKPGPIFL